ncbi:MAG: hypothetical protein JOZ69_11270 [Myxococcales bacterium]|nr:hypothetical protein [Myxococcales bacterium]
MRFPWSVALRAAGFVVELFDDGRALIDNLASRARPTVLVVDAWAAVSSERSMVALMPAEQIVVLFTRDAEVEPWRAVGATALAKPASSEDVVAAIATAADGLRLVTSKRLRSATMRADGTPGDALESPSEPVGRQ